METPKTDLKVFSALLMQEYIRIMTAAVCLKAKQSCRVRFNINQENYAKMMEDSLTMPLIGLDLTFDEENGILSVVPDDDFLLQYDNQIMASVAEQYYENYKMRYVAYISIRED